MEFSLYWPLRPIGRPCCDVKLRHGRGLVLREPFDVETLLSSPWQFSTSQKVEPSFLSSVHQVLFWNGLRMHHNSFRLSSEAWQCCSSLLKKMKQPTPTGRSWYFPLNVFHWTIHVAKNRRNLPRATATYRAPQLVRWPCRLYLQHLFHPFRRGFPASLETMEWSEPVKL